MAFGKDGAETMETNLSRQAYNLFLSLAAGGGLGLLYDLLFTPEYGEKKHAYVREGLFLALSFAWLLVLVLFLEGEFGAAFFFVDVDGSSFRILNATYTSTITIIKYGQLPILLF